MPTKEVSDTNFDQEVLQSDGVVLVDFWAKWCGPCRQIAPALEELSQEIDGDFSVVKVDIDENPTTPMQFGVRGVPTMILFKDGQPLSTKVGADAKSNIEAWIKESISAA